MLPLLISEDKQELFDHAVQALWAQGKKSMDEGGATISMAGPDRRCPLGWCLSAMALKKAQEIAMLDEPACCLLDELIGEGFGHEGRDNDDPLYSFLNDLAECHDNAVSRRQLREKLMLLAIDDRLDNGDVCALMTDAWCAGDWE